MSKENEKLEQAMDLLKSENTKERLSELMEELDRSTVYLSAALPSDTPPELIRQIADAKGEMKLPDGLTLKPSVLKNADGELFLPVFSTEEKAKKGNKAPLIIGTKFSECMNLVTNQGNLHGVVLNAFDQNITLNRKKDESKKAQKEVTLTEEQLHAVLRQQVEATVLPNAFFEEPEEMVETVRQNAGECIMSLYEELYPEGAPCPYDEEDFEAMLLNIRDDLTVIRIVMPEKRLVPGTCPAVLLSWNPEQKKVRYFGIVRGEAGEPAHVYEALPDGSKTDLGEAPDEGGELQFVIDVNET